MISSRSSPPIAKRHGPEKQESGLRLDAPEGLLAGGNSGAVVAAGDADGSLLLQAIVGAGDVSKMPPKGPGLEPAQIELVRRWIVEGAKTPDASATVAALCAGIAIIGRSSPSRIPPPAVKHPAAVLNPLDAFIVAGLEAAGLEPSPAADRATLLRAA